MKSLSHIASSVLFTLLNGEIKGLEITHLLDKNPCYKLVSTRMGHFHNEKSPNLLNCLWEHDFID